MTDETNEQTEPNAEMRVTRGGSERVVKVDYPSNSNRARQEKVEAPREAPAEKKVDKVISGSAKTRKRGIGSKLREAFHQGDDMQSLGDFILFDVVIPQVRALIADIGIQAIERSIGGARVPSSRSNTSRFNRPTTNYNGMYKSSSSPVGRAGEADGPSISRRARAVHEFDEIVLPTRGDADLVLERLGDLIDQYDVATVADLYDLAGVSSTFTDNRWGWSSLAGSGVERVRGGGYILILPRTEEIK